VWGGSKNTFFGPFFLPKLSFGPDPDGKKMVGQKNGRAKKWSGKKMERQQ